MRIPTQGMAQLSIVSRINSFRFPRFVRLLTRTEDTCYKLEHVLPTLFVKQCPIGYNLEYLRVLYIRVELHDRLDTLDFSQT